MIGPSNAFQLAMDRAPASHVRWSNLGRSSQSTNLQRAGVVNPPVIQNRAAQTTSSIGLSFRQMGVLATMSADEPASFEVSDPSLAGVLLVTGPEGKEAFWGRTQVVFGIMDTVVRDPLPKVAPKFFGMSGSELEQSINASAWSAFERGEIEEAQLQNTYFKDGRSFDLEGFKAALVEGYELTDGMPELLWDLQAAGHKLHGFTDYPEWYTLIELKLGLEATHGLQWTSVSCDHGLKKTEPASYLNLLKRLGARRKIGAAPILLIDSKAEHCKSAEQLGISSVRFEDVAQLRKALGDILGSRKRGTAP